MNGMTKEEVKQSGLTNAHAYTLLDAKILNEKTRLVKIRNPYGDDSGVEWKGTYSDQSKEMTPDVRKQLGMKDNPDDDDGEFWMTIQDFKKFFYSTTICHYRPNYKHITVADTHADTQHAVSRVDVLQDTEYATFILT
jgi:hypothetical protein